MNKLKNSNIISNFVDHHINVSDSDSDSDSESDSDNESIMSTKLSSTNNSITFKKSKNINNNIVENGYDSNYEEKEKFHQSIKEKQEKKGKKKEITTTREYLNIYNEYKQKFAKVAVLICVGTFYEMYALENEGPDVYQFAEDLEIRVTKKNKSNKIVSEGNPITSGFPACSVVKFMEILHSHSYTVVLIDQFKSEVDPNSKNKKVPRRVSGVYSPSTYIEAVDSKNKYLSTFYIEVNPSLNGNATNFCIGMCATDLSIGDIFYYESYDNTFADGNNAIEEANHFYYYYKPVETVVYLINNTKQDINFNKILSIIDIPLDKCVFKHTTVDKSFESVNFQNKLLKKVYKNVGLVTPVSYFNLEKFPYSIIAMCLTFDFIFSRNKQLLNDIKFPIYFNENKYLILGNGAQYQLDVVDYSDSRGKNKSLNSIINHCKTCMGKRFLKNRLCAPLTDIDKINKYYEYTDCIINDELYDDSRTHLSNISDIKKLLRKINVNNIHPYQLHNIYESFLSARTLYEFLNKSKFKQYINDFMNNEDIKQLNKAIKYITKTFDIDKIKTTSLIDIKESFYNKDVNKEIDDLIIKINGGHEYFDKLKSELSNKFKDTKFHIKRNDRDGYYLSTTRNKGDKILEYIKEYEKKNDKEKEKETLKISDNMIIKLSELNILVSASTCKITCSLIGVKNDEMNQLFYDLDKLIKNTFTQDLRNWYSKYNNIFEKVISFVTEVDFISNNAYISNRYHYCKPEIIIKETKKAKVTKAQESFVTSTHMRHPIIERGIQHEYVPHNVCLDKNTRGNLIYGVNSCGKSSLMKSIGINVVLAQCGMFVSASDFKYYPFKSLYTRITGNDDMRNGYSSFVVELNELRNILKKSNKNTLIIGDEICRGTEYLSANSLVASSILKINDSKAKYIFATHLHELVKLEKIKKLDKLKMFHLSIQNLNSSDELIFNRKLVEGNGEEVYGITIAKHILNDPDFITTAIEFKNEFLKEKDVSHKLMSDKKSNYNKNIYLDSCYLCGSSKSLESHHINFQKDFINDKGKISHKNKDKNHLIKNSESNIIILCSKCHDDLHNKKISINTIVQTTNGVKAI